MPFVPPYSGYCPICDAPTVFQARKPPLRAQLVCRACPGGLSLPRERALALVLSRMRPGWRDLAIHESSPAARGISVKMKDECAAYVGSHYFPDQPFGDRVDGWVNQDLQRQTFADGSFDIVISLDVFEHVFDPARAHAEIWRSLKPGGIAIHTFPIIKQQTEAMLVRASIDDNGVITHHKPAEYHGNPVSKDGALVTVDYGHDIHRLISEWAPFSVSVQRFADRHRGILGEFTEVVVCEKHAPAA